MNKHLHKLLSTSTAINDPLLTPSIKHNAEGKPYVEALGIKLPVENTPEPNSRIVCARVFETRQSVPDTYQIRHCPICHKQVYITPSSLAIMDHDGSITIICNVCILSEIEKEDPSMSAWNHHICQSCWNSLHPDREPIRIREEYLDESADKCCICQQPHQSGIYLRGNPIDFNCHGQHKED